MIITKLKTTKHKNITTNRQKQYLSQYKDRPPPRCFPLNKAHVN